MIQFKGDSVLTFPAPLMTDTVVIELSLRTTQVSIETVCSFSGVHVLQPAPRPPVVKCSSAVA